MLAKARWEGEKSKCRRPCHHAVGKCRSGCNDCGAKQIGQR